MTRHFFTGAAAFALCVSLAACGQKTETAADGAATGAGQAVDKTQDAAGAAVGMGSGAMGAMTADAFVKVAGMGGMYEIESSKIALKRSSNSGVKKAAQGIIDDHTKASAELKALVDAGKAPGPLPMAFDERNQGFIDNLNSATAANFDDRYIDQQTAAHSEALTAFKGYADHGDNADLKAFAAKAVPVLEMHSAMLKGLDRGTPADDAAGMDMKKQ